MNSYMHMNPPLLKELLIYPRLPFRLMLDTDEWSGTNDPNLETMKPALEMWALYSYNLHKATYEGLNALENRKNKRNFIIGRGSFAGAHKWAGLWTGDNASTWDHFRISVCQVRTKTKMECSGYLVNRGLRCLRSVFPPTKLLVQTSEDSCLPQASPTKDQDMQSQSC